MASYNLSELFEDVADVVPDREALITPRRRLTFAQLDARATRLAHHLAEAGIGAGDHVGLHLMNGTEYIEGMLAAFKLRAVPVNVNYRYVERELEYLYENADLAAVIFDRAFGPRVAAVAGRVPTLRHLVVVDDDSSEPVPEGAVAYESALEAASPERDFTGRSGDDLYIAYTGGTTGMPKGVVWRQEDLFFASMSGGDPAGSEGPITEPEQLVERVGEGTIVQLVTPPLMHVSAHWGTFMALFGGGTVALTEPGSFDPAAVVKLIDAEGVNVVVLVGDAMARPLLDEMAAHRDEYDLSSLFVFASGGAAFSPGAKAKVHEILPNAMVLDGYGSTETGVAGTQRRHPGAKGDAGLRIASSGTMSVLDDDLKPVEPGSGVIGRVARRGHIPLRYHKDEQKTAETFAEVEGVRWVLPGDFASLDDDGSIVMHGRGSVSINTGGEKVFPEEVESAIVDHDDVTDVVVVGVPDERWGQRVAAVVQPAPGATPDLASIQEHCRSLVAGYKIPRELVLVDQVERSPSGKADYRWASAQAESAQAESPQEGSDRG
ncbi:MAG: acyl-CoA synthetase [Acidimicrobiia bacterium]|nr:acyl-CoA synthetase [Acidimicrobiia bacterium]